MYRCLWPHLVEPHFSKDSPVVVFIAGIHLTCIVCTLHAPPVSPFSVSPCYYFPKRKFYNTRDSLRANSQLHHQVGASALRADGHSLRRLIKLCMVYSMLRDRNLREQPTSTGVSLRIWNIELGARHLPSLLPFRLPLGHRVVFNAFSRRSLRTVLACLPGNNMQLAIGKPRTTLYEP